ncbi:hypothetical protein J6590_028175 [Homalodisca vitripennis]|nr:hypothetical protein J6590_028175 [Homalodisca vitripennis]
MPTACEAPEPIRPRGVKVKVFLEADHFPRLNRDRGQGLKVGICQITESPRDRSYQWAGITKYGLLR